MKYQGQHAKFFLCMLYFFMYINLYVVQGSSLSFKGPLYVLYVKKKKC